MMKTLLGPLVLGVLAIGCGADSSGVDGSKKIIDLSPAERGDVCDYTSDVQGGYGTMKVCGDGLTLSVKQRMDCITNLEETVAGCTATVENLEACSEAVGEDLCKFLSEPACAFLLQCSAG
jgi:hypothetical protein